MFLKSLLLCLFIVTFPVTLLGTLTLNNAGDFMSFNHFNPGRDISQPLLLLASRWQVSNFQTGSLANTANASNQLPPFFTDPPLVHPSPLSIKNGGVLGYGLSRNDMILDFRIYDAFGYEILKKEFKPNQLGGLRGYNRIELNPEFFDNNYLPAGVYLFVFIHNDELLGKGKFAVVP